MSCILTSSPRVEENTSVSDKWIRGVTQGALFKISEDVRQRHLQKIIENIAIAEQKTSQWLEEGIRRGVNLDKTIQMLIWTDNDITEVSAQSNQLSLVNLQRKHTMLQVHCCHIISKITKKMIREALALVQTRLDNSNAFQRHQLKVIKSQFLKVYNSDKTQTQPDIHNAEAKSAYIRQKFLYEISLLVSNPAGYQALLIKKNTLAYVEMVFARLGRLHTLTAQKSQALKLERLDMLETLQAIEHSSLHQIANECDLLIKKADRIANEILLAFDISWSSGFCGSLARSA